MGNDEVWVHREGDDPRIYKFTWSFILLRIVPAVVGVHGALFGIFSLWLDQHIDARYGSHFTAIEEKIGAVRDGLNVGNVERKDISKSLDRLETKLDRLEERK